MKTTKRAARAALVVISLAAAAPVRAAETTCRTSWDLASAYLTDPTLCGSPEWDLFRSEGATGALTALPNTRTNWGMVEGIFGTEGTESCNYHGCFPVVAVNRTGIDQVIPLTDGTLVVPAGAVWIHPAAPENGKNGNAAVAFRSPFTGRASVTIALTRIHPGLISWEVDVNGKVKRAPEILASGTGTYAAELDLEKGDLLTVRVDSATDGYGADSSLLTFTVNRLAAP